LILRQHQAPFFRKGKKSLSINPEHPRRLDTGENRRVEVTGREVMEGRNKSFKMTVLDLGWSHRMGNQTFPNIRSLAFFHLKVLVENDDIFISSI
jgi:hypothetical protein